MKLDSIDHMTGEQRVVPVVDSVSILYIAGSCCAFLYHCDHSHTVFIATINMLFIKF